MFRLFEGATMSFLSVMSIDPQVDDIDNEYGDELAKYLEMVVNRIVKFNEFESNIKLNEELILAQIWELFNKEVAKANNKEVS